MRTTAVWLTTAGLAGLLSLGSAAQTQPAGGQKPKLSMTRIYLGSDGKTHFEQTDVKFPESNGQLAPLKLKGTNAELSPFSASPPSSKMVLRTVPERVWEIGVSGRADIEGAGGKKIYWETGVIHLLEDTSGKGHGAIITEPGIMLKIPVSEKTPRIAPGSAAPPKGAVFYRLFYPGADGTTFHDNEIKFTNGIAKLGDSGAVLHRDSPGGPGPWHSTKSVYAFVLRGSVIIESMSGESTRLGPGSMSLIDDATSSGHRQITEGPGDVVFLTIQTAAPPTQ